MSIVKFTSLVSGSKGNAYLVEAEGERPLLLEAGIPIKKLREKLFNHGVKITDLAACLISHSHFDHSKAVKDLLKAGVNVWLSIETMRALNVESHRAYYLLPNIRHRVDENWMVLPFALQHDVPCFGFYIAYKEERFLFVPDTAWVEHKFSGITQTAIECNFINEILSEKIISGALPAVVGHRIRRNHMNLETLIQMLKSNDLSKCRAIYLIHLSDGNSDEAMMVKEVQKAVGIPCYAM